MIKTIIMIAIVYSIVAFIVKVLINVFDWWFSEDFVDADWIISMLWIFVIPVVMLAYAVVSIGEFAEWLADKIKDMLGW
jgi:hypothetical protein